MRTTVHYLTPTSDCRRLRSAVHVAIASGVRVGLTFGNGVMIIPPGYTLEAAHSGMVALRGPDGGLVVYRPRRPRLERPRAYVRADARWLD